MTAPVPCPECAKLRAALIEARNCINRPARTNPLRGHSWADAVIDQIEAALADPDAPPPGKETTDA